MRTDEILEIYSKAGYPAVAVESFEEKRLVREYRSRFQENNLGEKMFSIAAVGGIVDELKVVPIAQLPPSVDATANYTKAFEFIAKQDESVMFVFDFQYMVNAPTSYRPLIRALATCKARGTMIVMVAPVWKLPEELKHMIPVIRMELPTIEELEVPLQSILKASNKEISQKQKTDILSAARGLTLSQAEDVFALSSRPPNHFDYRVVEAEKMKLVRSDYMSVESPKDEELLGGLGQLKSYLREEVLEAKDDPQLQVKGVLLVGVPGTGKSLSSRIAAKIMNWPLVRFDISAAKGSLVGQSEANMRKGLQIVDAIAPCVLWLDEIEKAIGGHASSGQTDGGTTLAMVGTLLTWMQEHKTPVFVIATCNDFNKLPSELVRAGRFDERFFLDLPNRKEREEIANIHLKALRCDNIMLADSIAEMCEEWTPAEIEQLIKSAARRTKRKVTIEVLDKCRNEIIPISKSASIKDLREWASVHLRKANDLIEVPKESRRLRGVKD